MRKQTFVLLLFLLSGISSVFALEADSLKKHTLNIGGLIRTKYEYNSSLNEHRFQVRNARFGVNGYVTDVMYYKAEIDLSDEGVTKMLDAYIRFQPVNGFSLTLGQQKIPFSTDNLRSPNHIYFANRSFIAKQVTGLRDVGATFCFKNDKFMPMSLKIGIYNGDGLYDQQNWKKDMAYVTRLEFFPLKNWEVSLNYNNIRPEDYYMHFFDLGSYVNFGGLHLESEFVYKIYQDNFFDPTKAFFVFGSYDIPFLKWYFTKISPVLRYDMMTDNNQGYKNELGTYTADFIARSRVTGGVTLSLNKPFLSDIRLNYEKYFYAAGIADEDDKFVVELVVKF